MAEEESVHRGMTAAELERQYNFRARWPEHTEFVARWAADSVDARSRLAGVGVANLAYGPHPRQTLDLFRGGDDAPLLAFLHGGYWRALSKDDFSFIAAPFVEAGVAVAVIGYGLCPDVSMADIVAQVRVALRWLHGHASGFGVNPDRIVAAGHSAGAHLAVTMAGEDWTAHGAPPGLVKAAVGISGIYDLEPLRFVEVNGTLGLDADAARRLSPLHRVPARPVPPLLLALGAQETGEVHRQQADMAAVWRAAGGLAEELEEAGAHHFSVVDRLADPTSALHRAVRRVIAAS